MSNEGIRFFQEMLEDREFLELNLLMSGTRVLHMERLEFWPDTHPATWALLQDVAERLAASSPWVSDDPVAVKAREIAPHLIIEEWCDYHRLVGMCGHAAEALTGAEAFTVYTECEMAKGVGNDQNTRDFGGHRGSLLVAVQSMCMGIAVDIYMAAVADDLYRNKEG